MREDHIEDAWHYSTNALISSFVGFIFIGLGLVLLFVALVLLLRSGVIQLNEDPSPEMNATTGHVMSTEWNGTTVRPKVKPEGVFTVCIIMC